MTVRLTGSAEIQAVSPAALAAGGVNDYAGADGASFARLTGGAGGSSITGIANGVDGRLLVLLNVGADNVTLTHQDAASAAANRIITGTGLSVTMTTDDIVILIYDATTARWRQLTGLI